MRLMPTQHFSVVMSVFFFSALLVVSQGSASVNSGETPEPKRSARPLNPGASVVAPGPRNHDQIRAMITDTWHDALATWSVVLDSRVFQSEAPNINFVAEINGTHCYGLYAGAGPVYCSGNSTVFVSVAALDRMGQRYKGLTAAGMTFLVAHELGHHIQKLHGRFQVLSNRMRREAANRRELAMHFELEADCLAGVWAGKSRALAQSPRTTSELRAALDLLGDDNVQLAATGRVNPATFTHGSSIQRRAWFEKGLASGTITACEALNGVQ